MGGGRGGGFDNLPFGSLGGMGLLLSAEVGDGFLVVGGGLLGDFPAFLLDFLMNEGDRVPGWPSCGVGGGK